MEVTIINDLNQSYKCCKWVTFCFLILKDSPFFFMVQVEGNILNKRKGASVVLSAEHTVLHSHLSYTTTVLSDVLIGWRYTGRHLWPWLLAWGDWSAAAMQSTVRVNESFFFSVVLMAFVLFMFGCALYVYKIQIKSYLNKKRKKGKEKEKKKEQWE